MGSGFFGIGGTLFLSEVFSGPEIRLSLLVTGVALLGVGTWSIYAGSANDR